MTLYQYAGGRKVISDVSYIVIISCSLTLTSHLTHPHLHDPVTTGMAMVEK